ncbi:MAG: sterol desaturase [Micavibrio sp.]|nr:sterol desaturase [Micavibrio sp.]|tara:strand:- start:680934 stop:681857 length:924 start_codon:yes stop_codon:yes gene_type:complete
MSQKQERFQGQKTPLRLFLSWTAWPGLLILCLSITAYGFSVGHPLIFFNVAYLILAVTLLFLERWMPHEPLWLPPDGQIWADIGHTLTSKGTVQAILIFGGVIGLSELIKPVSVPMDALWPREWPMAAQVVLGLVVAEFGLYWAHRVAHEWPPLWPYHAVHHSVKKLWIVNTGRFHFIDSLISIVLGSGVLFATGAPLEVIQWLSAITAFIGMLTHCNVEMRFGVLSWVFNTPELHRWHHSKDLSEGDKNYGENVMLWDWIFFSHYNQKRRPPLDIGIKEEMPPRFLQQLKYPFTAEIRWKNKDFSQ